MFNSDNRKYVKKDVNDPYIDVSVPYKFWDFITSMYVNLCVSTRMGRRR
jgi:hypothetical protein